MKHIVTASLALVVTLTSLRAQPIPVELSKHGHILIRAKVNGVEGRFIFDTGAGIHVISQKFFRRAMLVARDSAFNTGFRHTGERLDGYLYRLDALSFGSITQNDPWIGVFEGFDNMDFDGILSCKLIEHHTLTFDHQRKEVFIDTAAPNGGTLMGEIPLWITSDRDRNLGIFIELSVSKRYRALTEFDTGAGYSTLLLHTRYIDDARLDTTKMIIRREGTGYGSTEKVYLDESRKTHLQVTGLPEGEFRRIKFKPSLIYEGLVPYTILGDVIWTIDIPGKRILVYARKPSGH